MSGADNIGKSRLRTEEEIAAHIAQEGYAGHKKFLQRLPFIHPSESTTDPTRAAAFTATIICSTSALWLVISMVKYCNHFPQNQKGRMFNIEENLRNPKFGGGTAIAAMSLLVTSFWFFQALILWTHECGKKRNLNLLDHVRRKQVSKAAILDHGLTRRDEEAYNNLQTLKQAHTNYREELELEGLAGEEGEYPTNQGRGRTGAYRGGNTTSGLGGPSPYGNMNRDTAGAARGGAAYRGGGGMSTMRGGLGASRRGYP